MERVVEPEILDGLPADDPEARRSRRDLRLLNALMGNERWLARQVARHPAAAARGVVEAGAGAGSLAARLVARFPVTALDLAPRPLGLPDGVKWVAGDIFARMDGIRGGVLVANLFIHHFDGADLARLGEWAQRFDVVCLCEPWRSGLAHGLGRLMHPWINRVTRHDMHASIRGGFLSGEMADLLGFGGGARELQESVDWRGAVRLVARRRR
jgi:hypothetical protein